MKRFKITLLVPHSTEVVVADIQAAHNEATRLANQPTDSGAAAIVQAIEDLGPVATEEIDFGV